MDSMLNAGARLLDDLRPWTPTREEQTEIYRRATNVLPQAKRPRSWPPTEKTLAWCREWIPGFETHERQALSARAAKREAAG